MKLRLGRSELLVPEILGLNVRFFGFERQMALHIGKLSEKYEKISK
jgi:hypothetical protein